MENYFSKCHKHTNGIIRTEYKKHTHTNKEMVAMDLAKGVHGQGWRVERQVGE